MKVLFVVPDLFFSEPLGVMQLSAISKRAGHQTRLAALVRQPISRALEQFQPDVVGYSAMTANEKLFAEADQAVRAYAESAPRPVRRIMGGPHPTFFPEVLDELRLDAVVIGHGDYALPRLLERLEGGLAPDGIPNVLTPGRENTAREVVTNYDELPFMDRSLIYEIAPILQHVGIRSFMTQRACPYACTYCFNHAFNQMFHRNGNGLFSRRSVDHLIEEIRFVRRRYPPVRFVQFTDSVFAVRRDRWLEEFAEKYPRQVGLPFLCCVHPKDLTDEVARLLKGAGCSALSMSVETGIEGVRRTALRRNVSDEVLLHAFACARKYKLRTQTNTMLGLPGTTLRQDFESVSFTGQCRPTLATFSIFCPFPRTELAAYASRLGVVPPDAAHSTLYRDRSVLTCYSERDKRIQVRLTYLAPIFCLLPQRAMRLLPWLAGLRLDAVYRAISSLVVPYIYGRLIFRGAQPRNPLRLLANVFYAVKYYLWWK